MKQSVCITSDGTPYDVFVRNPETDEMIQGVRAVTWHAQVGEVPTAELEITFAEMDVEVENPRILLGSYVLTMEQWERVQAFMRTITNDA